MMMRSALLLVSLLCWVHSNDALEGIRNRDILDLRKKSAASSKSSSKVVHTKNNDDDDSDVDELYLSQRLDHFDFTNDQTYQQRYFKTDRYLVGKSGDDHESTEKPQQVVFLCVGGEGPGFDQSVLVDSVHCSGDMLELAHILHTSYSVSVHVYALEHRYYGKSYPEFHNEEGEIESPVTNKNLRYLSSRQALEDLAHFVSTIKKQMRDGDDDDGDIRWLTFGGSYPGYMAAMARVKYPHLVFAAVSNSAPLDLKVDFPEYQERVGWDLKYEKVGGSQKCYDVVKKGHEQAAAEMEKSHESVAELFNICNPDTALSTRRNQELLLGDGLIGVPAQGNDPKCEGDVCNIQQLCDTITTASPETPAVETLAELARRQRGDSGDDCVTIDWKGTLEELSTPTVTDEGWRSWLWQTCTEVGFYQTCKENCPYGSYFHLVDMDLEICQVAYNITNVYDNVQAAVDHYGGLDSISGSSRILSVNGDVDPWSTLAVKVSPSDSLPVVMVPGASHHFWTHKVQSTDSEEIQQVRGIIYEIVMGWLDVAADHKRGDGVNVRDGISTTSSGDKLPDGSGSEYEVQRNLLRRQVSH